MGFTPTIYVRKEDLGYHLSKLEKDLIMNLGEKKIHNKNHIYACKTLVDAYMYGDYIDFSEVTILVINTDLSTEKNKVVRQLLDELEIAYRLTN